MMRKTCLFHKILNKNNNNQTMLHFKEGKNMKKLLLAVLTIAAVSFAQPVYVDNPKEDCDNSMLNDGWCTSEGYICALTTEVGGAYRFFLGANSSCTQLLNTKLVTYQHKYENGEPKKIKGTDILDLDYDTKYTFLRPVLSPAGYATALGVATTGAWLLNAYNERYKVKITYYQLDNPDINSVVLLGVTKIEY